MRSDRAANALRPLSVTTGINRHAEGSALVRWGDTHVQATVTVDPKLPPHLRSSGARTGWLTAEYAMLPRATSERTARERLYASGRTQEIQRLIGRSLRAVTDLGMFKGSTLIVDVDVIQADGGTRCAGIVAGYAALHELANRLIYAGKLAEWPLSSEVGAVSIGLVDGSAHLDLDAAEDRSSSADLNVVATAAGEIIEVQGGAESAPIPAETYVSLVATGVTAVAAIMDIVRPQLAGVRA